MNQKKRLDYYLKHVLKDEDTFRFECKMCGGCCSKRDEPIVITGVDLYHIARALGKTVTQVAQDHCHVSLGPVSGLPVLTLKENENGECTLMKDHKCSIHNEKPTVCAIYPLGRMYSKETGFQYFTQVKGSCPGESTHKVHDLKEWKEAFHLEERDEETKAWYELLEMLQPVSKISEETQLAAFSITADILYQFDPEQDFVEQIKYNKEAAEKFLEVLGIFFDKDGTPREETLSEGGQAV